ncbi:MAG: glutamate racemase, partial [Peptostreptococcaceae bacterium]
VVVIACNTATAMALDLARKKYSIPIIGVIKAGSKTVVNTTKNNIIGVIGTDATIKSNSYSKEIKNLNKDITVIQSPCPLFVPIVEEGWANTEIARLTAKKYLDNLINKDIDSLVLGCTHYPILQKTIKEVTMGKINLVNPAKETAKELIELLKENKTLNNCDEKVSYDYYVSDTPQKFLQIADDFLNIKIESINTIDIKNY